MGNAMPPVVRDAGIDLNSASCFFVVLFFCFCFLLLGGPGGGFGGPGGGCLCSSKSSGKATTETIKKKATTRTTKTTTKTSPGLAPLPLTTLLLNADFYANLKFPDISCRPYGAFFT